MWKIRTTKTQELNYWDKQYCSPLQKIELPIFKEKEVNVYVKRDDLMHPEVSGNKWRKLKLNIDTFQKGNYQSIITFGGAYSNHILATAKAGYDFNIPTIGIIRGEETLPLNPTLKRAQELGMQLEYISRSVYRNKHTPEFLSNLQERHPKAYIIPEGGANLLGLLGCKKIVEEISLDFDYVLTDCGTGATLGGIALALAPHQKAIGIPVLKQGEFILNEVKENYKQLGLSNINWNSILLETQYHFGGYAKHTQELIEFMRWFYTNTEIKTDPIYTGKLFYALVDLIQKDYFPTNSTIITVHTGGLQGIEGFEKRKKIIIYPK